MRHTMNLLIANLAVADSLVLISHSPFPIAESNEWCKAIHFLVYLACNISVCALVALSVDRFLAIVLHTSSKAIRTTRNTSVCIVMIWILTSCHCIVEFFLFGVIHFGERKICKFLSEDGWDSHSLAWCVVLIGYVVPVTTMAILYSLIFIHIRSAEASIRSLVSFRKSQRILPMLIGAVSAYALCYAPMALGYTLFLADINIFMYEEFTLFYTTAILVNSSINPIIYGLASTKYREAFQQMLVSLLSSIRRLPCSGSRV